MVQVPIRILLAWLVAARGDKSPVWSMVPSNETMLSQKVAFGIPIIPRSFEAARTFVSSMGRHSMLSRQCDVHFMFSNRADGAAFRDGLLEKNSAQLAKTKVIAWIYIAPNLLPSCPKQRSKCQIALKKLYLLHILVGTKL